MKKYLLLVLMVGITSCQPHKTIEMKETKDPVFFEKKWDNLPEDKQVLGPVADPNDLDTVSVQEKRYRQAFDENHMTRDGHAHRAGFHQYEDSQYE